jgi:serpin B
MKRLIFLGILALTFSCTKASEVQLQEGSKVAYAFNFIYNASRHAGTHENVIVSPYSAGVALSMLAEGAEGETKAEILKAVNAVDFKSLDLHADSLVKVVSSNSIWLREGFKVKPAYTELVQNEYEAKVSTLDFSSPEAVSTINNWCSEKTEGLIPDIIKELSPSDVMYLLNALYFKAPWDLFKKELTAEGKFYGSKGQSDVMFMNASATLPYVQYEGCQMVEIPYADGKYSMTIVVPGGEVDIPTLLDYLGEPIYYSAKSIMKERKVALALPKFKIETTMELNKALNSMGMRKAFGEGDFSGITRSSVAVDKVVQKCYVEVSEEGTEAAAVTSIGVRLTAMRPTETPVVMKVDKPFFFMIKSIENDNVLFIGKVMNL